MLSQTGEYALRAVLFLADNRDQGWIPVDRIAEALKVPRNYLSKTLHVLAREGILVSSRGPHGGFRLASDPEDLRLLDVVDPFETLERRATCLLGRPQCNDLDPCPAHERWKAVAGRVASFFSETTVAQLLGENVAAKTGQEGKTVPDNVNRRRT